LNLNPLGVKGINAFIEALKKNTTIQYLGAITTASSATYDTKLNQLKTVLQLRKPLPSPQKPYWPLLPKLEELDQFVENSSKSKEANKDNYCLTDHSSPCDIPSSAGIETE
jgi:hypothetical protein